MAKQALEIKPQYEMAMILAANVNLVHGHYEKSQVLVDRAISTDPLNVGILMNGGDILILQRRFGEAINCLSQALELQPGMRPALLRLALARAFNGQHQAATESLSSALGQGKEDASYLEYRAITEALAGRPAESVRAANALEALADHGKRILPWSLARAWAMAGNFEKAMDCLKLAFDTQSSSIPFLGLTPVFDPMMTKMHTEMRLLMDKAGLPG